MAGNPELERATKDWDEACDRFQREQGRLHQQIEFLRHQHGLLQKLATECINILLHKADVEHLIASGHTSRNFNMAYRTAEKIKNSQPTASPFTPKIIV
jgi:hypothetical protein